MARFLLTYRGPATPPEQMTAEQSAETMQLWNAWTDKVGSAVVDLGLPFGARASVAGDGSEGAPPDLNGYTIVEATDLAAAKSFADGHPFLSTGEARFAVDVYELVPIPM